MCIFKSAHLSPCGVLCSGAATTLPCTLLCFAQAMPTISRPSFSTRVGRWWRLRLCRIPLVTTNADAQALQDDLRNSQAKGSGLERQVTQLSALVKRSNPGLSSGCGGNCRGGGGGDRGSRGDGSDLSRPNEVLAAETAALRRQMEAATRVRRARFRESLGTRREPSARILDGLGG